MFKNKKYIFIVFVLLILLSVFLYFKNSNNDLSSQPITQDLNLKPEIKNITEVKKEELKIDKDVKNIKVSLRVLDKDYQVSIEKGSTVYEVMGKLQENKINNFSFKSKVYPSLGIFINEINHIKGEPGKYWIYYINGKEASVSVSKLILEDGDIISWKQE